MRSRPRLAPGDVGWLGLVAYIIAFDLLAKETLSQSFYRAIRHPRRRWPVILAWAYVTAHLFHLLPHAYDPLRHPRLHRRTPCPRP